MTELIEVCRWNLPHYRKAINHNQFCQMREEFHNVYVLFLIGIDRNVFSDTMISDEDWLSVFKCPRFRGKVHLRNLRMKHFDDCMIRHQKVHQGIDINYKLIFAISRAFAYENVSFS